MNTDQQEPKEGDEKLSPCYCGGTIRMVFTRDKNTYRGWKRGHYRKPRWTIDNCYPNYAKKAQG